MKIKLLEYQNIVLLSSPYEYNCSHNFSQSQKLHFLSHKAKNVSLNTTALLYEAHIVV